MLHEKEKIVIIKQRKRLISFYYSVGMIEERSDIPLNDDLLFEVIKQITNSNIKVLFFVPITNKQDIENTLYILVYVEKIIKNDKEAKREIEETFNKLNLLFNYNIKYLKKNEILKIKDEIFKVF